MKSSKQMKKRAVCLISGGLDSCVAATMAALKYELYFLHLSYGQRTQSREKKAFQQLSEYFNLPADRIKSVVLPFLGNIGGSALTDKSIDVPQDLSDSKKIPVTYVPFRNSIFLSYAVAWAETLDAQAVVIGAIEADSAGYPDCRAEYFETYNAMIKQGTKAGSRIKVNPLLVKMDKVKVVKKGLSLNAPFELTWSCYGQSNRACGQCESCRLRLAAFKAAGAADPLPYRFVPEEYQCRHADITKKEMGKCNARAYCIYTLYKG